MKKNELIKLVKVLNEVTNHSRIALMELTNENPLVLFDKEYAMIDDESEEWDELQDDIYEMPIGYTIGKYDEYMQGAVWKVQGGEVVIFLTGEEWGELRYIEVDDLPIESVSALLLRFSIHNMD